MSSYAKWPLTLNIQSVADSGFYFTGSIFLLKILVIISVNIFTYLG
jgi:hypothetical protein